MTQVSITSATHPENRIDLTTNDNYQPEVEASDWEARMARLVGFVEESDNLDEEDSADDDEALENSATLEPSPSPSPEVRTEQPLSSNPFAKLGLVGTGTLAIVLLAGGFLSQMMSGSNQKSSSNNIVAPVVRSQPENESPPQALAGEIEALKTKLALTEQAEDVKAAQQQLRTTKIVPSAQLVSQSTSQITPPIASRYRQTVAQQTIPTPVQTVYIPRTMTVPPIVKAPSIPPQLPVVKPDIQPSVMKTPPPTPNPTPNPLEEWSKLAKLGSYGQVFVTERPNINQTTAQPQSNTGMQQQPSNPISQLQQQSPKSLAVGTSAKAVLATAVFGETTKSTNNNDKDKTENKNLFVVQLKEPLKAIDGTIAIPAKTEFLAEINSLSEQGLIQLNIVKLISQNQGNLIQQSLPPNSLVIRSAQGGPVIANQFPNHGSSVVGMDLGLFVLGGLGKAAELFNRTSSQIVTSSGSGTVVENTNPQPDVFTGLLEGGMNTIVPLISQRNQQAISQMMQRTNIWFMPAGTEVKIYVNQQMQF